MLNYYDEAKTVKIPVKIVDGQIMYFYGGKLPQIQNGVIGDLTLPEYSIEDMEFLKVSQLEEKIEILPKDSVIMVAVSRKNIPENKKEDLKIFKSLPLRVEGFIKVVIMKPLELLIRGSKKAILMNVDCCIPSLNSSATSINDAYTIISQEYETSRKSHTGNVFTKCYYWQEGEWFPLETIRDREEGKYDKELFLNHKVFILNENYDFQSRNYTKCEKKIIDIIFIYAANGITGKQIKEQLNDNFHEQLKVLMWLMEEGIVMEKAKDTSSNNKDENCNNQFILDEEDYKNIKIYKSIVRRLLKHPKMTPKQIIGLGNALYALEKLPCITFGVRCEVNISYEDGDSNNKKVQFFYFEITDSYIQISKYRNEHSNCGSDIESGSKWRIELHGYKDSDWDLYDLEEEIIEYFILGAKIEVDDLSSINFDTY